VNQPRGEALIRASPFLRRDIYKRNTTKMGAFVPNVDKSPLVAYIWIEPAVNTLELVEAVPLLLVRRFLLTNCIDDFMSVASL
jgi:hypothetical protein